MEKTTMENELKRLNPEWFEFYKQSEQIAINKWLPGISQRHGSYNSYPHIRGIVQQIDNVLFECENDVILTAAELYVLLNSILFHDVGKIDTGENHDERSKVLIEEHWSELNIISEPIARIIENICGLHDRKNEDDFNEVYNKLYSDHYIDSFGNIRGRLLGALLYLGDHLDGSFTRTLPNDKEFEKHFRQKVFGIRWLPKQQMICTVINPNYLFDEKDENDNNIKAKKEINEKVYNSFGRIGELLHHIDKNIAEQICKNYNNNKINNETKKIKILNVDAVKEILADVYENDAVIKLIRNELYVMGTPIKRWMIECEGYLFTVKLKSEGWLFIHNEVEFTNSLEIIMKELDKCSSSDLSDDMFEVINNTIGEVLSIKKKIKKHFEISKITEIQNGNNIKVDESSESSERYLELLSSVTEIEREVISLEASFKALEASFEVLETSFKEKNEQYFTTIEWITIQTAWEKFKKSNLEWDEFKKTLPVFDIYTTKLTVEPVLGLNYCENTWHEMFTLSSSIFAKRYHSYSDLTNMIREDPTKVEKVKFAVRRLSLLVEFYNKSKDKNNHKDKVKVKNDENKDNVKDNKYDGKRLVTKEIYYDEKDWKIKQGRQDAIIK